MSDSKHTIYGSQVEREIEHLRKQLHEVERLLQRGEIFQALAIIQRTAETVQDAFRSAVETSAADMANAGARKELEGFSNAFPERDRLKAMEAEAAQRRSGETETGWRAAAMSDNDLVNVPEGERLRDARTDLWDPFGNDGMRHMESADVTGGATERPPQCGDIYTSVDYKGEGPLPPCDICGESYFAHALNQRYCPLPPKARSTE